MQGNVLRRGNILCPVQRDQGPIVRLTLKINPENSCHSQHRVRAIAWYIVNRSFEIAYKEQSLVYALCNPTL